MFHTITAEAVVGVMEAAEALGRNGPRSTHIHE